MPGSPKKKSPKKSKERVQIENLLRLVMALEQRALALERRALALETDLLGFKDTTEQNHEDLSMEVRRLEETVEDHQGELKVGPYNFMDPNRPVLIVFWVFFLLILRGLLAFPLGWALGWHLLLHDFFFRPGGFRTVGDIAVTHHFNYQCLCLFAAIVQTSHRGYSLITILHRSHCFKF